MISVFIVDDHPVVVEGIRSLLINEAGINWVGHALNAASCNAYIDKNDVDVILMDINLPDKSGIDLCLEVRTKKPVIKILALSTLNQPSYIHKMMENGASGYVLKNADKDELLDAIHEVAKGNIYLCLEALEVIKNSHTADTSKPVLTRREQEILTLIAQGLTNNE